MTKSNDKWDKGYIALTKFFNENGHTCVKARHIDKDGFRLGEFVRYCRRHIYSQPTAIYNDDDLEIGKSSLEAKVYKKRAADIALNSKRMKMLKQINFIANPNLCSIFDNQKYFILLDTIEALNSFVLSQLDTTLEDQEHNILMIQIETKIERIKDSIEADIYGEHILSGAVEKIKNLENLYETLDKHYETIKKAKKEYETKKDEVKKLNLSGSLDIYGRD